MDATLPQILFGTTQELGQQKYINRKEIDLDDELLQYTAYEPRKLKSPHVHKLPP